MSYIRSSKGTKAVGWMQFVHYFILYSSSSVTKQHMSTVLPIYSLALKSICRPLLIGRLEPADCPHYPLERHSCLLSQQHHHVKTAKWQSETSHGSSCSLHCVVLTSFHFTTFPNDLSVGSRVCLFKNVDGTAISSSISGLSECTPAAHHIHSETHPLKRRVAGQSQPSKLPKYYSRK